VKRPIVEQLIGVSTLIERKPTLEDGLRDLAALTARSLGAGRCSVMLLAADDGNDGQALKVFSHFGDLPEAAYATSAAPHASIAWHVVGTGKPVLVNDLQSSPLAHLAAQDAGDESAFMSAPIKTADRVVGVINVAHPSRDQGFGSTDLDLLELFALFVGKSIHVFQLEKLAESRLLQMAHALDARGEGGDQPISPDPARIAKTVAKSFYRELAAAGFGPKAIIAVATEVLGQLNENLSQHRSRIERDDPD
jgi:GAF domain-containing protein